MKVTTHHQPEEFVAAHNRACRLLGYCTPNRVYNLFVSEGMDPSLALSAVVAAKRTVTEKGN